MTRELWKGGFSVVASILMVLVGLAAPSDSSAQVATHTVLFGQIGDLAFDPAGGAGGATRDLNRPNSLVVNPGDTIDFVNRSGGQHQVAVFGPNLRLNGSSAATIFGVL